MMMSDEKRLTKHILENYERVGRVGRPVWNTSDVIEVAMGLSLVRVNEVDTERQTMDSLAWLTMVSVALKYHGVINGNIFHVTGPWWGESTGHRWIPLTKASDAELWCFLWCTPEKRLGKWWRCRRFDMLGWKLIVVSQRGPMMVFTGSSSDTVLLD